MQNKHSGDSGLPMRPSPKRKVAGALWLAGMVCTAAVHAAGVTINPGDSASMARLTVGLDCDDLVVNGTLDIAGATFTKVGNVIIGAGGVLNASGANIQVNRGWANTGAFSGAGSTVTVGNNCANTSTSFAGNTTFFNLSATSPGHTLNLAAGEQQVAGLLTLNGVNLVGQSGTYLTLLAGGTQNIGAVGVNQVDASHGQHLAPTLDNQTAGGNAPNWFRSATTPVGPVPVPANGPLGLALMALLLCAAAFTQRWPGKSPRSSR